MWITKCSAISCWLFIAIPTPSSPFVRMCMYYHFFCSYGIFLWNIYALNFKIWYVCVCELWDVTDRKTTNSLQILQKHCIFTYLITLDIDLMLGLSVLEMNSDKKRVERHWSNALKSFTKAGQVGDCREKIYTHNSEIKWMKHLVGNFFLYIEMHKHRPDRVCCECDVYTGKKVECSLTSSYSTMIAHGL